MILTWGLHSVDPDLILWPHPSCKAVQGNVDSWLSINPLSSACHFFLAVCLFQNVAMWVKTAKIDVSFF